MVEYKKYIKKLNGGGFFPNLSLNLFPTKTFEELNDEKNELLENITELESKLELETQEKKQDKVKIILLKQDISKMKDKHDKIINKMIKIKPKYEKEL